MRVIVAGGTGFLGRHVTAALLAAGHRVVLLARGTRVTASAEGVEVVRCDVGAGPVPLEALRGSDALINLVGIKREEGTQTFARVHVDATRRLLATAKALGLRRFVHVSVVCSRPDARSGYHDTKWRAEQLVRASGLEFTILKPAVVYGPGDDMVTHLVKMIRFAPVFPVVGRGDAILQPVHVQDVALAATRALDRNQAVGKTYDVVGPTRMTLRAVVGTVAEATDLKLWIVNTPVAWQRIAVRLMDAVTRNPLSTPAQLQMLVDGLYGDPAPAAADLGIAPTPFTAEVVRELATPIPPLFGFTLRHLPRLSGPRGKPRKDFRDRYGPWALVTGASSGIGAQFARELAAAGINLVLVARRIELLNELKQELVNRHKVEVITLQVDLSQDGCEQAIHAACDTLDIGLVVNNAGSGVPGPFASSDVQAEKELIRLNCITPVEITHHFLPKMQARGRGGIIFVSSLMGFQGVPYMANYSATKGYLLNFGESLYHECKGTGVDVLVLAPGATDAPGKHLHRVDYAKLPISWMTAEKVVDAALKKLGRKPLLIPGLRNHLTACLSGGLWSRGLVQGFMTRLAHLALRPKAVPPPRPADGEAQQRLDTPPDTSVISGR